MIYIGMSRVKNESVSFVKKQLEMLHLQLISITSRQVIEMLKINPSFDLMGEMYNGLPLVRRMAAGTNKSATTFLNMYQPLKMTKQVEDSVGWVLQRNKPPAETFFFGVLMASSTVVGVFRASQRTKVAPADINLLVNFMTEHSRRLKKRAPCFFSICMPGLTEEFKMSVFFHTSNRVSGQFGLKLVIVTEEASAALMDRFETLSNNIFSQLNLESMIERIEHLEKQMFTKQSKYQKSRKIFLTHIFIFYIELKELQHMVVCHKPMEQYSGVNLINAYSRELYKEFGALTDNA